MDRTADAALEQRVLIAAPTGRDSEVLAELLEGAGYQTVACATAPALREAIARGAALAVVAREVLGDDAAAVCQGLAPRPEWSDFPLILLAPAGHPNGGAEDMDEALKSCSDTVVLERPLSRRVLLSAVGAAYRARQRQYQVRDELARRRRAQRELAHSEARYRALYENAPLAYQSLDRHGRLKDVNPAWLAALGYQREAVLGLWLGELMADEASRERFRDRFSRLAHGEEPYQAEYRLRCADGGHLEVALEERAGFGEDGRLLETYGVFRDITIEKQYLARLEHMVRHDGLTGLPNRALLADRLTQAMAQLERRPGTLALVFVDLDGFKAVNDRYGHEAGDRLLKAVTRRMAGVLRDADTLARVGGDELVALLVDLPERKSAVPLVDRLRRAAAAPVVLGPAEVTVSASLGVTFFPQDHPVDAEELLRQADHAMYEAKMSGKDRYHVFDGPVRGAADTAATGT